MKYNPRISDKKLERKLNASGAVLIRGTKACGKTESAKQLAQSILFVIIFNFSFLIGPVIGKQL
ncbi:hypothetical protein [Arachidicoccus sp.]|jgi:hypothetical protein|uniref:hypothetical protein n=1 Tax=Arachidicoccus sp. TaxID=1872624 RepID=UPI003D1A1017